MRNFVNNTGLLLLLLPFPFSSEESTTANGQYVFIGDFLNNRPITISTRCGCFMLSCSKCLANASFAASMHAFVLHKQLSKSNIAKDYTFDTDKIYTFHYYDHTADISNYEQDIGGILKVDLTRSLNGQPLSLSALWLKHDCDDKENTEGREQQHQYMYRFEIWHDKIL